MWSAGGLAGVQGPHDGVGRHFGTSTARRFPGPGQTPVWPSSVAIQIGGALATAHAHDVVHCDVRPEIIRFDSEDHTHLGGFAIAVGDLVEESGHPLRGAGKSYAGPVPTVSGGVGATAGSDQFAHRRSASQRLLRISNPYRGWLPSQRSTTFSYGRSTPTLARARVPGCGSNADRGRVDHFHR